MRPFSHFRPILQLDLRWPLTLIYDLWPHQQMRVPMLHLWLNFVEIHQSMWKIEPNVNPFFTTDYNRQQCTKWSLCVFPANTGDTKMTNQPLFFFHTLLQILFLLHLSNDESLKVWHPAASWVIQLKGACYRVHSSVCPKSRQYGLILQEADKQVSLHHSEILYNPGMGIYLYFSTNVWYCGWAIFYNQILLLGLTALEKKDMSEFMGNINPTHQWLQ